MPFDYRKPVRQQAFAGSNLLLLFRGSRKHVSERGHGRTPGRPLHGSWIQKKSFPKIECFSQQQMKAICDKDVRNRFVVVRAIDSQKVLGFAWVIISQDEGQESLSLMKLARHPGAARLGIGNRLLKAIIDSQQKGQKMHLCVRRSNQPAILLYQRAGFVPVKELPNYYSKGPKENGVLMRFDWNRYSKHTLSS